MVVSSIFFLFFILPAVSVGCKVKRALSSDALATSSRPISRNERQLLFLNIEQLGKRAWPTTRGRVCLIPCCTNYAGGRTIGTCASKMLNISPLAFQLMPTRHMRFVRTLRCRSSLERQKVYALERVSCPHLKQHSIVAAVVASELDGESSAPSSFPSSPTSPTQCSGGESVDSSRSFVRDSDDRNDNNDDDVTAQRSRDLRLHLSSSIQTTTHPSSSTTTIKTTAVTKSIASSSTTPTSIDSVTDEEVLLACRWHLAKTHRLPWAAREERRRLRVAARGERRGAMTDDDVWENVGKGAMRVTRAEGVGCFWDYPDDLPDPESIDVDLDNTNDLDDGLDDEDEEDNEHYEENVDEDGEGDNLSIEWDNSGSQFTSYQDNASDEHVRRSQAAKKMWSDPNWKANWYARRWGDGYSSQVWRRKINAKLHNLPPEVLQSPELEALGEEDVAEIVRRYLESNRKRAESRRERERIDADARENYFVTNRMANMRKQRELPVRRVSTTTSEVPDKYAPRLRPLSFLSRPEDEATLREAQKRRSEKSTAAYRTRRSNLAQKKRQDKERVDGSLKSREGDGEVEMEVGSGVWVRGSAAEQQEEVLHIEKPSREEQTPTKLVSKNVTKLSFDRHPPTPPKRAFADIIASLGRGETPLRKDVEIILAPGRLAGRKNLLLRILRDRYGLSGKCVPKLQEGKECGRNETTKLMFAAHCTISDLGNFVLQQIDEDSR